MGSIFNGISFTLSVSPNGSYWLKLVRFSDDVGLPDSFSIPERIVLVETGRGANGRHGGLSLSVSPNGSYWLKPQIPWLILFCLVSFSIPERIVLVETGPGPRIVNCRSRPFSIPERIVLVETAERRGWRGRGSPFSIPERIVLVETQVA